MPMTGVVAQRGREDEGEGDQLKWVFSSVSLAIDFHPALDVRWALMAGFMIQRWALIPVAYSSRFALVRH